MESQTVNPSQQQPTTTTTTSQAKEQQQQCQPTSGATTTQAQPVPSGSKNIKNLSIKEFFTTRLMRARSFEGGGHSPKDETSSWFDEFKARMTKKSQAKSSANQTANDDSEQEFVDTIESTSSSHQKSSAAKTSKSAKAQQAARVDDIHQNDSLVKDVCDTSQQQKSLDDYDDEEEQEANFGDDFNDINQPNDAYDRVSVLEPSVITSGLRTKKNNKISSARCPDFDTASINTIFNRRDSRYDSNRRRRQAKQSSAYVSVFRWLMSKTLPLNYNLPWKLLTMMNISFVVIVLAVVSRSSPGFLAFNFFNGFVCGVFVAALCFLILVLSLLTQFLPSPPSSPSQQEDLVNSESIDSRVAKSPGLRTPNVSFIESRKETAKKKALDMGDATTSKEDADDETDFEEMRVENNLDDDDYKGWMIEFVGDYEQRHKADFKLKLLYVRIEDRILQLCKPKNSHDAESATLPVFSSQRTYDLNTAKKFSANIVLPKTVRNRQKWVWSKKYPIRLEFQDDISEPAQPVAGGKATNESLGPKMIQLTLFAKSCREKEEWFRRFKKIVEENRIALGQPNKRASLKTIDSDDLYVDISNKSFGTCSPSPSLRRDCVQTSRSSHVLSESIKKVNEEDATNKQQQVSSTNLTRTKSCELLQNAESGSTSSSDAENNDRQDNQNNDLHTEQQPYDLHDDSTLTRETAELFSQAIEYSNFIESQPTLNYKDYIERVIESSQEATSTSDWFNALTGRIFFDVFSHNFWSVWFKRKIQRKLYRIRLPYFMETLTLTQIDLGTNAPQFLNVVSHSFDSFGLSIDFDMAYSGGLTMTFATKLNLLKIKADNSTTSNSNSNNTNTSSGSATAGQYATTTNTATTTGGSVNNQANANNSTSSTGTNLNLPLSSDSSTKDPSSSSASTSSYDNNFLRDDSNKPSLSSSASTRTSGESSDSDGSDSSSSSDSSFDEAEVDEISDWEDYGAEKTRQSIVKFVDKIASSRYFQSATENKYIKKKLQDISNCPLVLVVKIVSLNGVLTVNVPPPQTDRVWYGFKPNPELTLKALPKMGDREVNLSHVTDWIERKLAEEFRKILVIPNMEDVVLPVLKSDHLLYVATTKQ